LLENPDKECNPFDFQNSEFNFLKLDRKNSISRTINLIFQQNKITKKMIETHSQQVEFIKVEFIKVIQPSRMLDFSKQH